MTMGGTITSSAVMISPDKREGHYANPASEVPAIDLSPVIVRLDSLAQQVSELPQSKAPPDLRPALTNLMEFCNTNQKQVIQLLGESETRIHVSAEHSHSLIMLEIKKQQLNAQLAKELATLREAMFWPTLQRFWRRLWRFNG